MLESPTLDQLRMFVAVAERGSFRAAAQRLGRVQSAVSAAIAKLEGDLQLLLFDRAGHRPELTDEGRALLADARILLMKADAFKARANGFREGVEAAICVAVDPLLPLPLIARSLVDLRRDFPSVGVRLRTAPLGAAIQALLDDTCSTAFTTADIRLPRVEAQPIATLPAMVRVCAAGHPLAVEIAGKSWSDAELADHVQIVVSDPSPVTGEQLFGVVSPDIWRVGDIATKLALIREGAGWGSLPPWLVEDDLAAGRLVPIGTGQDRPASMTVFRLHRSSVPLGPAARHLSALLAGKLCHRA